MKRWFKKFCVFATCLCVILGINSVSYAQSTEFKDLDVMKPYRDIVEKVNHEFGQTLVRFPTNDELQEIGSSANEAYSSLINMSLDEYENRIRELCISALSMDTEEHYDYDDIQTSSDQPKSQNISSGFGATNKENNIIQPKYVRENIIQYGEFGSGDSYGKVFLESTVFSAQGISYIYESIKAYGYVAFNDRVYFKAPNPEYNSAIVDSSKKNCKVKYVGYPYDPITQTSLTVSRTVTVTFSI